MFLLIWIITLIICLHQIYLVRPYTWKVYVKDYLTLKNEALKDPSTYNKIKVFSLINEYSNRLSHTISIDVASLVKERMIRDYAINTPGSFKDMLVGLTFINYLEYSEMLTQLNEPD